MSLGLEFGRLAPQNLRRRLFKRSLRSGHLADLGKIVGRSDPFPNRNALFRAVDYLWELDDGASWERLAPLARRAPPFDAQVWRALCLWREGAEKQAFAALERLSNDNDLEGYERRGAAVWAMFLQLPRFFADGRNGAPNIAQFWDTPAPPPDVAVEMQAWRELSGPRYQRFNLSEARRFLANEFGAGEAKALDMCPHPAVQSDYFRLGWLLAKGGVYVDADARMRSGFTQIYPELADRTVLWFETRSAALNIQNNFIAAARGQSFTVAAFSEATRRLVSGDPMHVLDYAGSSMCAEVALDLFKSGSLRSISTIGFEYGANMVQRQIPARYKSDYRGWNVWLKQGEFE